MHDNVTDKGTCDACLKAGVVFERRCRGFLLYLCIECIRKDADTILHQALIGGPPDYE